MSHEPAQIFEADQERDRRTCINLDLKISGANRELAQWLLDHPRYSGPVVAGWIGCHERRIRRLRLWAEAGFVGSPYDKSNATRNHRTYTSDDGLESLDNLDSEHVESADVIEDEVLHTLQRSGAVASATKKILKVSSLDREAKARISEAINRLIAKWRSIQTTLTRKAKP